jgi:PAP2 superfamily C-terminal
VTGTAITGTAIKGDTVRCARPIWSGSSLFRVVVTAVALVFWFWSQKLIGERSTPSLAIGDRLHALTASANFYLRAHPSAADLLLIVSSGVIDLLGVFLLLRWIVGAAFRPFLGLVIVLGLRQIMQSLVALPAPANAIWHYPGFPSLLVTYSVSNDYFFSGHTAIAVLAASEIGRLGKPWLTAVGVLIVVFEVTTVLVLRAHYTMDVFAGIVTGLYAAYLASRISFGWCQEQGSRSFL